jgi:mono/diheme cytochrome c family protein
LGAFLYAWDRFRCVESAKSIYNFILFVTIFFGVLSCVTGFLLAQTGGYETASIQKHQYTGIAFTLLVLGFYFVQNYAPKFSVFGWVGLSALLSVVGHLGGNLTHGEDFLAYKDNSTKTEKAGIDIATALVYPDVIQPILQEKCYTCHNANKQKGDLRLDQIAFLLKGGKHGSSVVAGNAAKSLLISRCLLPSGDEEHMPPKGKPQLSQNEVKLLEWWINAKLPEKEKVASLPQSPEIKQIVAGLAVSAKAVSDMPTDKGPEFNADAVEKLMASGISVLPIAAESNYLSVSYFGKDLTPEQWQSLEKLADNIIQFKAKSTHIDASAQSSLAKLTKLQSLFLNNLKNADFDPKKLSGLSNLKVLSLSGTSLNTQALASLNSFKTLSKLYLYNTGENDLVSLQKNLGKVTIDTGGYRVPTLVSDTTAITLAK